MICFGCGNQVEATFRSAYPLSAEVDDVVYWQNLARKWARIAYRRKETVERHILHQRKLHDEVMNLSRLLSEAKAGTLRSGPHEEQEKRRRHDKTVRRVSELRRLNKAFVLMKERVDMLEELLDEKAMEWAGNVTPKENTPT